MSWVVIAALLLFCTGVFCAGVGLLIEAIGESYNKRAQRRMW